MPRILRALLSVTDKNGVAAFASGLHKLGVELISTGGTAALLRKDGIAVRDVSEVTGFPEMLDGRVKTIHPLVAGGMLAIRSNPQHMQATQQHGIPLIDMVVVNLYDFAKVAANKDAPLEELIENIDIGGPTMIRAAAKNWQDVAVVVSPADYDRILRELSESNGKLSKETCWNLSLKAWATTASYDHAVSARLSGCAALDLHVPKAMDLRYGENPHQQATLYAYGSGGIAGAKAVTREGVILQQPG